MHWKNTAKIQQKYSKCTATIQQKYSNNNNKNKNGENI
jgi:hypothetical protein